MTHLPGSRNPSGPLSRLGFPDGDGPAVSTGDPAAESQQDASAHAPVAGPPAGALWLDAVEAALFSERSIASPVPSMLVTVRVTWTAARRHKAAVMFANTQEGGAVPSTLAPRGLDLIPACSSRWQASGRSCAAMRAPRRSTACAGSSTPCLSRHGATG